MMTPILPCLSPVSWLLVAAMLARYEFDPASLLEVEARGRP